MLWSDVRREHGIPAAHAAVTTRPDLATRLAQRDRAALAELYDGASRRAFGLAYRVLGDGQAAEDVVQDAFLWIWEHADRLDASRGTPEALLLTVTHRRAIDALRRRNHRQRKEQPGADVDAIDESAFSILAAVEAQQIALNVRDCLAGLAVEQREAIELAYFGGMTQAEIAERQDVALGTVKSRTRLGLARLRAALGGGSRADV
jgi:RNA polymerase sigma-70 factor (ECF subfamily)